MKYLWILLIAISLQAQVVISPANFTSGGGGEPPTGYDIDDDFTTDEGNFVDLVSGSGAIVTSGYARAENDWSENFAYYDVSLGSADHCVRADVQPYDNYPAGLMFRIDPTADTGYIAFINSGNERVYIETYSGGAGTYATLATLSSVTVTSGNVYEMLCTISGSTINVYVDWNDDGDFDDTDEHPINAYSNSTYSSGNYIGVYWNSSATFSQTDNLIGDASACTE